MVLQTMRPESGIADMTSSSSFFDVVVFLLSSLGTGPYFKSISLLILELGPFSFIRVDQKSGSWKYPRLSFAQHLETGES